MGFNTVAVLYNDLAGDLSRDDGRLSRRMAEAIRAWTMRDRFPQELNFGAGRVVSQAHADYSQVVVVGHNSGKQLAECNDLDWRAIDHLVKALERHGYTVEKPRKARRMSLSPIVFGWPEVPCEDCTPEGRCTMNCSAPMRAYGLGGNIPGGDLPPIEKENVMDREWRDATGVGSPFEIQTDGEHWRHRPRGVPEAQQSLLGADTVVADAPWRAGRPPLRMFLVHRPTGLAATLASQGPAWLAQPMNSLAMQRLMNRLTDQGPLRSEDLCIAFEGDAGVKVIQAEDGLKVELGR